MKKLFAILTGALLLASSAMAAESEGRLTDYQEAPAAEVKKETPAPKALPDFKYTIHIQYKDAPEMEGWMKAMQALCNEWYPKIIAELNSPDFKPYPEVNLTVRSDPKGVAATGGKNIFLSKQFFTRNGTDAGAIIHELTHVVQAYPKYIPWITEAIADYIRLYVFEPNGPRPPVNPKKPRSKMVIRAAPPSWPAR
jgi:hypothetical protein